MDIGKMRSKISIWLTTKVSIDEIGGVVAQTIKNDIVWANVRRVSGERAGLLAVEHSEVYEFTFRAGTYGFTTHNEIGYADKLFTVHSVANTIPANFTKVIAYVKDVTVL